LPSVSGADGRVPLNAANARRFFAEDLRVTHGLTSERLIDAIAAVPRERFLPPGPWLLRGPHDSTPRISDDDDPRHVYHDIAIAIRPEHHLYNGQPSLIATWLQTLGIDAGNRVLHIGCGTGYFTGWIAHMVGGAGHVFAIDVDAELADRARDNLAEFPWVEVRTGDGVTSLPSDADVVLVHAGASHVLPAWLDALRDGGRLLVPLTCEVPGMPPGISKGMMLLATRQKADWIAKAGMPVAIYSMRGMRAADKQAALGQSLMAGTFMRVKRLRRDSHQPGSTCCVHDDAVCLASE
jgi:protein-L-isoaspartate(D-aspartate) O-methyltransferase